MSKGSSRLWFLFAILCREHCDMINLFVTYSRGWTAGTLPACYVTLNGIPSNSFSSGAERKPPLFHRYRNDRFIWRRCCLHTAFMEFFMEEFITWCAKFVGLELVVLVCSSFKYPCRCLDLILNLSLENMMFLVPVLEKNLMHVGIDSTCSRKRFI